MMNERTARKVLGVLAEDDAEEIRRKYRSLMRKVHPDNFSDQTKVSVSGAQELNEAYAVLKKYAESAGAYDKDTAGERNGGSQEKSVTDWDGPVNPMAFSERRIFFSGMEHEGHHTGAFQMSAGKYLWDPENEEFEMLLRSVGVLTKQIFEKIEDRFPVWMLEQETLKRKRLPFQQEVFHLLMLEYVDPAICLDQLVRLFGTDGEKSIYKIPAELKWVETDEKKVSCQPGELLYPAGLKERRLYVKNSAGRILGYLTFEEDWLFYAVIPLLERKDAQVKILVGETKTSANPGNCRRIQKGRARHLLELYIKLTVEEISVQESAAHNREIEAILDTYARYLRKTLPV